MVHCYHHYHHHHYHIATIITATINITIIITIDINYYHGDFSLSLFLVYMHSLDLHCCRQSLPFHTRYHLIQIAFSHTPLLHTDGLFTHAITSYRFTQSLLSTYTYFIHFTFTHIHTLFSLPFTNVFMLFTFYAHSTQFA